MAEFSKFCDDHPWLMFGVFLILMQFAVSIGRRKTVVTKTKKTP